MEWQRDMPQAEGWYLWRRRTTATDPWGWHAYFVTHPECGVGMECWENGTHVQGPAGGWWAGPIPLPRS